MLETIVKNALMPIINNSKPTLVGLQKSDFDHAQIDVALALHNFGFVVIPLLPGTKRPDQLQHGIFGRVMLKKQIL